MSDNMCDLCMASGVSVSRITLCGKTIGIECGCDEEHEAGVCDDTCADCQESAGKSARKAVR